MILLKVCAKLIIWLIILLFIKFIDKEKEWTNSFSFIQAADPQFGLLTDLENSEEGIWTEELRRARLSVAVAKKLEPRPRFFIVCGDMTHAFPGNLMEFAL